MPPVTDTTTLALDLDVGDTVEIATAMEAYNSPFEVTDTSPVVEWRVPHDEDWTTRELELQESGTTWYLTYNDGGPTCRLYSAKADATGEPVIDIIEVEDADSDEVYCGHCGKGSMSAQGGRVHHGHKHPEEPRDLRDSPPEDSEDWDVSIDVPEGVTPAAVEAAVDERDTLRGIVEELDWPQDDDRARGRVRTLVYSLGRYEDLSNPEGQP
ncbi:hypothetical protein [Halobacterium hubeiense]|uniref:hypothetical protein n=1 Tax=Halobacterium hubeiense TaxID=1407499 RepID=UPI000B7F00F0|nr:hypothetical protein [Halobacterium hubeiense]